MNQFMLILQDNTETGELDIAGTRAPEEFHPLSPAHIVGKYLQANINAILDAAKIEWDLAKRIGTGVSEDPVDAKIILQ